MAFQKEYIGCRPGAQYTYYDGCFVPPFVTVPPWQALHRAVARCVATAERQLGAPPTAPRLQKVPCQPSCSIRGLTKGASRAAPRPLAAPRTNRANRLSLFRAFGDGACAGILREGPRMTQRNMKLS